MATRQPARPPVHADGGPIAAPCPCSRMFVRAANSLPVAPDVMPGSAARLLSFSSVASNSAW